MHRTKAVSTRMAELWARCIPVGEERRRNGTITNLEGTKKRRTKKQRKKEGQYCWLVGAADDSGPEFGLGSSCVPRQF